MQHKVVRSIKCLEEIDEFLNATSKFGKKFIKWRIIHHEVEAIKQVWVSITAIGISRDLVYLITWQPEAESLPDTWEEDVLVDLSNPHAVRIGNAPFEGRIPKDPKVRKRLYPNYGAVPDKPGEHHWLSLFAMHGFVTVDTIEEL